MRMGAPLPVVSQYKNTDSLEPVGSAQVSVNEVELHECAGVVFISFKGSKQRSQFIQHVDEVLKKPAKERLSPFEMFGSVCDLTVVNGRSDLLGYHFREGTLFLTGINL